jgi:hypothetical protein
MNNRAIKTSTMNLAHPATRDDLQVDKRTGNLSTPPNKHSQTTSRESFIQSADDADGMFTHAPVSLWEEDFSEVKRRLDQLKRDSIEDLRKHFKQHPDEVLSLARMVRIVRINNETLALYDAAGPVEFQKGLSQIFNKKDPTDYPVQKYSLSPMA